MCKTKILLSSISRKLEWDTGTPTLMLGPPTPKLNFRVRMQQNVILRNKSREGADVGNTDLEGNSQSREVKKTWRSYLSDQRHSQILTNMSRKRVIFHLLVAHFRLIHGFHV